MGGVLFPDTIFWGARRNKRVGANFNCFIPPTGRWPEGQWPLVLTVFL